jgi:hypothetical protein
MKKNPAQSRLFAQWNCTWRYAALFTISIFAVGCAEQKPKARTFPWGNALNVRPALPDSQAAIIETPDLFSDVEPDAPPPPSPLAAVRAVPAKPRVPAPSLPSEPASKPEIPEIAPQMTAEETTAAQQQTNQSVSIAERNVEATQGKTLNATQLDLVSKIRSFISEARDASHAADWNRARTAAKKAEVLSVQLASSL